jgi:hypothetical protein
MSVRRRIILKYHKYLSYSKILSLLTLTTIQLALWRIETAKYNANYMADKTKLSGGEFRQQTLAGKNTEESAEDVTAKLMMNVHIQTM